MLSLSLRSPTFFSGAAGTMNLMQGRPPPTHTQLLRSTPLWRARASSPLREGARGSEEGEEDGRLCYSSMPRLIKTWALLLKSLTVSVPLLSLTITFWIAMYSKWSDHHGGPGGYTAQDSVALLACFM